MPRDDPYKYFRVEGPELLERLGMGALAIDKGSPIEGGVAALLRHAHTLKGAARVVKQVSIAEHAHAIEEVLSPHRALAEGIPRECAGALFAQIDAIAAELALLSATIARSVPSEPPRGPAAGLALPMVRAEIGEVDAVVQGLGQALAELELLERTLGAVDQTQKLAQALGRQLAAPRRSDPQTLSGALERAQRGAEELVSALAAADRRLRQGLERLGRELEDTHATAERLRLVSVSSIFTSLERAVYDAAQALGKKVTFAAVGGEIKLDGHMLSVMHGALLHVVRNAVAHGLEREPERIALGKPPAQAVRLTISRRGGNIIFDCRDDGAGFDVSAARRVLRENGEDERSLPDDQVLMRLLEGGVSTSDRITNLSGRGIGLDVVRDAAQQLGGSVKLESSAAQSFGVEVSVPFVVAAVVVVSVECEGRTLTLPLDAVLESTRFSAEQIVRATARETVCHQGRVIPFAALARAVGLGSSHAPQAWSALILRTAGGTVAVGVDRLIGTKTVVLRPLPAIARASAVVAGASLDVLGNPELVLDCDALVGAVFCLAGAPAPGARGPRPILVIDDSLTTRMLEQSILESAGYEVTLATSGEDGLEKARARPYALFLVDVEMPGIDGFTFVDTARRDPELAAVPAVLVSSRSAPEDLARGKAVGAYGYIVKDRFDQRELLGLIERLVGD